MFTTLYAPPSVVHLDGTTLRSLYEEPSPFTAKRADIPFRAVFFLSGEDAHCYRERFTAYVLAYTA